jgi:hypothetical protein
MVTKTGIGSNEGFKIYTKTKAELPNKVTGTKAHI